MNQNTRTMRLLRITLIIFIWYGIGQVALSISIEHIVEAIIEFAITAIAIYILIDGRLLRILQERKVRAFFLVPIYLLIGALIYDIIVTFQMNDLFILDQLHVFGLITYIISSGLIILTAIMLWETIALTREYFILKQ